MKAFKDLYLLTKVCKKDLLNLNEMHLGVCLSFFITWAGTLRPISFSPILHTVKKKFANAVM